MIGLLIKFEYKSQFIKSGVRFGTYTTISKNGFFTVYKAIESQIYGHFQFGSQFFPGCKTLTLTEILKIKLYVGGLQCLSRPETLFVLTSLEILEGL